MLKKNNIFPLPNRWAMLPSGLIFRSSQKKVNRNQQATQATVSEQHITRLIQFTDFYQIIAKYICVSLLFRNTVRNLHVVLISLNFYATSARAVMSVSGKAHNEDHHSLTTKEGAANPISDRESASADRRQRPTRVKRRNTQHEFFVFVNALRVYQCIKI